jgi:Fe-S-cluster formation regulator IscX/YfhJ
LTRRELLISSFDDHIITLRILSRRFTGADRFWDLPTAVNPDWQSTKDWYNSLWLFELLGIKACKYPRVLENGAAAEYATPKNFARSVSSMMLMIPVRSGTSWYHRWRALPTSEVELDPRYVMFRTMHDWVVLCARVLAERGDAFDDQDLNDGVMDDKPRERVDPFKCELPPEAESDAADVGMSCGNPRERLVGGRASSAWDPNFLEPEWRDVQRPWAAMRYQHLQGLLLPMELRYGALREHSDPRLAQLELLEPEIFREYVAGVLASSDDVARSQAWRARSAEDVRCDPRFIAHKCGFDSQMILHMVGWTPNDDKPKRPS